MVIEMNEDKSNAQKYLKMIKERAFEKGRSEYFYIHLLPVVEISLQLSAKYNVSREACLLAAIFHDVGRIDGVHQNHEKYGAKFAENTLKSDNYPREFILQVSDAIRAHESIKAPKNSVEAVLRSADGISQIKFPFFAYGEHRYLSRMGFEGLKRFNGEKIENAFDKICFDEEKKSMYNLYMTRKSIFASANGKNTQFCLFTTPMMYRRALWEITQACNLKCKHCLNGDPRLEENIPFSSYKEVINKMKEYGVDEIYFTGGEVFSMPHFVDVLEYAHQEGMLCSVATNGTLITQDTAERISQLGLKMLQVSFDGPDRESHDFIRGNGNFERSVEGLSLLHDILRLRMSAVIMKHTQDRLEEFAELAVRLGMDELILNWPQIVGRMKVNSDLSPTINQKEFLERYAELVEKFKGKLKITTHVHADLHGSSGICHGGDKLIFISSDGRLSPCSWIHKCAPEFISKGNIFKEGFATVVKSQDKFVSFVDEREKNGFHGCPFIAFQQNGTLMSQDSRIV